MLEIVKILIQLASVPNMPRHPLQFRYCRYGQCFRLFICYPQILSISSQAAVFLYGCTATQKVRLLPWHTTVTSWPNSTYMYTWLFHGSAYLPFCGVPLCLPPAHLPTCASVGVYLCRVAHRTTELSRKGTRTVQADSVSDADSESRHKECPLFISAGAYSRCR